MYVNHETSTEPTLTDIERLELFTHEKERLKYFKKWRLTSASNWNVEKKEAYHLSFNWSAFFFTASWMFYRKMYMEAFMVLLFLHLMDFLTITISVPLNFITNIVLFLGVGFFANHMYLYKAKRDILAIKDLEPSYASEITLISNKGGTSAVNILYGLLVNLGLVLLFHNMDFIWF